MGTVNLLSSLCYGAAISLFFAALSSFLTYKCFLRKMEERFNVDDIVKNGVEIAAGKWLCDTKLNEKINCLGVEFKKIKTDFQTFNNDCRYVTKEDVGNFVSTEEFDALKKNLVSSFSNEILKINNKISRIKITFE